MSKLLDKEDYPRESSLSPRPDLIIRIDVDGYTILASQSRSPKTMQQTAAEIVDHLIEIGELPEIDGDISAHLATAVERQNFLASGREFAITKKALAPGV